ncbi:MAG: hypothetical protein ABSA02_10910 [Trebonia sp.]
MPSTEEIRPLTDVPEHGFGRLGGLAHSVLAEDTGLPPAAPRLYLGQNTLPDPPFPMAAVVPFGDLTAGFRQCEADLAEFLRAGARALRTQRKPQSLAFSQQVRILQRALRFDSIAMVLTDVMIWSAAGAARWPLAAEVVAGRRGVGESAVGRPARIVCAVDRAGDALLGWRTDGDTRAGIEVVGAGVTTGDGIVALLRDVLLAQHAWASAVFGVLPLPRTVPPSAENKGVSIGAPGTC